MAHNIGKTIAELRKGKGWTQGELAEKLSVTDKAVSKWENGAGNPDIATLPLLAKLLGVTIDELLTGKSNVTTTNESVFAKIASGKLDLLTEIENGINIDGFDEYHKSLADYCAEKNNIKVFRLLVKLNKVHIANKTETRSNMNLRPGGKETLTYEDVLLYDRAYYTGKYDNPYPKDYNDSELVCLLLRNREDELLKLLHLEKRALTKSEADYIADDFDYFYKQYFVREFPSHIGVLVCALIQKGKRKEAQKLLSLISDYKGEMERKCAECEKSNNTYGKTNHWTINWNTGLIHTPVYDKTLKKSLIMKNKIMAYCWGTNEQPFIIGNAIIFTQDDLVEIGFIDRDFLSECRKVGFSPDIDEPLMTRLLNQDDVKLFEAFIADEKLSTEVEKLIINSNGKIKAAYMKKNTPQNINDVVAASDLDLLLSMLSTPKAALQYSKEVALESLGSKKMFPILQKIIPFLEKAKLDKLLNEIVETDNIQARLLLIDSGAVLYKVNEYGEKVPDKVQTEILYKLLKMEDK